MKKQLKQIIKNSKIIVRKGRYAYLKCREKAIGSHFLVSQDKDEITVVTEEKNISGIKYEKIEKWFRLFEIRVSVPFLGVGFLAEITKAIAAKNLNVLVVSTFSKDYILVRENSCRKAITALRNVGFSITEEK